MQARILFLFTLLCAAVAGLQSLHAAIITVTTLNDSGPGSLRQALADATDGDAINFSVSGTIRLTSDELAVNANIVIDGPGADMLAVNGDDDSRVFHISLGKTVTISDLTITQGKADLVGDFFFGGGIYNDHSTLTLSNCTLSRNSAQSGGGGIYNDHSTLTVSNCTLSGNSAGDGGGIFNDGRSGGRATLSITNSTFDDNWSRTRGGGILNTGGAAAAERRFRSSTAPSTATGPARKGAASTTPV